MRNVYASSATNSQDSSQKHEWVSKSPNFTKNNTINKTHFIIQSSLPKHINLSENVLTAEFHNQIYLFSGPLQYTNLKWYWNMKNLLQLEIQGIANLPLPKQNKE